MDSTAWSYDLRGKSIAELSGLMQKAYMLSRRTNIPAYARWIESQRAKRLMSYIVDEGARQQRLKKMNTRRNIANHNTMPNPTKKIYLPSPLGPRKTLRRRKN